MNTEELVKAHKIFAELQMKQVQLDAMKKIDETNVLTVTVDVKLPIEDRFDQVRTHTLVIDPSFFLPSLREAYEKKIQELRAKLRDLGITVDE